MTVPLDPNNPFASSNPYGRKHGSLGIDRLFDYCAELNQMHWVRAKQIEYYVADKRVETRPLRPRHDQLPNVTAAEARVIVKNNPSSWGHAMVKALEEAERRQAERNSRKSRPAA